MSKEVGAGGRLDIFLDSGTRDTNEYLTHFLGILLKKINKLALLFARIKFK